MHSTIVILRRRVALWASSDMFSLAIPEPHLCQTILRIPPAPCCLSPIYKDKAPLISTLFHTLPHQFLDLPVRALLGVVISLLQGHLYQTILRILLALHHHRPPTISNHKALLPPTLFYPLPHQCLDLPAQALHLGVAISLLLGHFYQTTLRILPALRHDHLHIVSNHKASLLPTPPYPMSPHRQRLDLPVGGLHHRAAIVFMRTTPMHHPDRPIPPHIPLSNHPQTASRQIPFICHFY